MHRRFLGAGQQMRIYRPRGSAFGGRCVRSSKRGRAAPRGCRCRRGSPPATGRPRPADRADSAAPRPTRGRPDPARPARPAPPPPDAQRELQGLDPARSSTATTAWVAGSAESRSSSTAHPHQPGRVTGKHHECRRRFRQRMPETGDQRRRGPAAGRLLADELAPAGDRTRRPNDDEIEFLGNGRQGQVEQRLADRPARRACPIRTVGRLRRPAPRRRFVLLLALIRA